MRKKITRYANEYASRVGNNLPLNVLAKTTETISGLGFLGIYITGGETKKALTAATLGVGAFVMDTLTGGFQGPYKNTLVNEKVIEKD